MSKIYNELVVGVSGESGGVKLFINNGSFE